MYSDQPDSADLADEDYQRLAEFRRALRRFLRFSEDAARAAGVTPAQHQLLLAIRGFDGAGRPTVGDMAEALQLRHHSAVELVDRAADAGLVVRKPDPDDARRQRLALTPKGRRTLQRLAVLHRAELRRFRDDMLAPLDQLR